MWNGYKRVENCLKPFTRNAIKLENNLDGKLKRFLIKCMYTIHSQYMYVCIRIYRKDTYIIFICLNINGKRGLASIESCTSPELRLPPYQILIKNVLRIHIVY